MRRFLCRLGWHRLDIVWDEPEGWLRCADCDHKQRMTGLVLLAWIKYRGRVGMRLR